MDNSINISKGHPNPKYLPIDLVTASFHKALETSLDPDTTKSKTKIAAKFLQYGPMPGNPDLIDAIIDDIKFQNVRDSTTLNPKNFAVFAGGSNALDTVVTIFTKTGDTVIVDAPAYFLSFYVFIDHGLNAVDVPTDDHGMNVDELEKILEAGTRPSLLYTVPICNNPNGTSMTEERKMKLVALSKKYNFKIASDEVYQDLTFDINNVSTLPPMPSSLFEYDTDPENPTVFAIHSFSKTLGPGTRLGWIEAHASLIDRCVQGGLIQSAGGLNPFMSTIVVEMLKDGSLRKHIQELRKIYGSACKAMCDALDKYVAPIFANSKSKFFYYKPKGGFFLWVTLPEQIDARELQKLALEKYEVHLNPGPNFSSSKQGFPSSFRLCFTYVDEPQITEGVERLGNAIKGYLGAHQDISL